MVAQLERHARIVDQTAVAVELLRAAEYRKESNMKHQEGMNLRYEKWLRPSHVREIHDQQVTARLDGTCYWIESNAMFNKWTDPTFSALPDRLLCISGTHGCGKSVLSSSIVIGLEKDQKHALFFSFSSTDVNRSSSKNLIRTIFWQLLQKNTDVKGANLISSLMSRGQPLVSELWESLGNLMELMNGPVYCIIDGVDECSDFDQGVVRSILKFLDACPNIRFLLLGRPHTIQSLFQTEDRSARVIEIMPAMLDRDIEAFITDQISGSDVLQLSEIRDRISIAIKERSDGMFLWVKLMIDELRKSSTRSEMIERLQSLPHGLEEAYTLVFSRLVQRLDRFELHLTRRALAFIVVSCRPLTFEEFRHIYAFESKSTASSGHQLEDFLLLKPVEALLAACGGLIRATNGSMRLIHSSLKDFLLRSPEYWIRSNDTDITTFRIDMDNTHQVLASLSLDYINMEKDKLLPDHSDSLQVTKKNYPFLEYAIVYAVYHLNRSGSWSTTVLDKVQRVLKSPQGIYWVETFAELLMEDPSLDSQLSELSTSQDLLDNTGATYSLLSDFETCVEKHLIRQIRFRGKEDPQVERWQMFLNLAKDGEFDKLRGISEAAAPAIDAKDEESRPELGPHLQSSEMPCSEDHSKSVSQVIKLLDSHSILTGRRQIDFILRLGSSLRNIRGMIDPLKVLFRLILEKASSMPVYVLMVVGHFYHDIDKYAEALEVYLAAAKKIDHLDVPVKYFLFHRIGVCYERLKQGQKAVSYIEVAYNGRKKLFGERHRDTLWSLYWLTYLKYWFEADYSREPRVALKIYNCMFSGLEMIPRMAASQHLGIYYERGVCYHDLGQYNKTIMMMEPALRRWESSEPMYEWTVLSMKYYIAKAYWELYQDSMASEWAWKVLPTCIKALGPKDSLTLDTEDLIGDIYCSLGQDDGLEWLRKLCLTRENTFGVEHWRTLRSKKQRDTFYDWSDEDSCNNDYKSDEEADQESLQQTPRASSIISSHSSIESKESFSIDFEYPEVFLPM